MNENDQWERDALREIALEGIRERRRARRWGIFFKILLFIYLFALLAMSPSCEWPAGAEIGRHTAVVDVDGEISAESPASAQRIIDGLRAAYSASGVAGVVLRVNSPGGSPVQAGRVYDEIRRLRKKHADIPVYAVAGDICASGAYYIASAADRIYADKASMVGSIGVIMRGFGFNGALDKLGVERRVHHAGSNKDFLDPFEPEKPSDVEHANAMLERIHQQFIDAVKAGRGDRLGDDPELFSGLMWTGEKAKDLGLVDGFGSTDYVAREVIGAETTVNYTVQKNLLQRLADRVGASAGEAAASALRGLPRLE